jgi:hypothetical protein
MVKLARPPFRDPLPSVLAPSLKVIVPVRSAVPGAFATVVAVKVTAWLCPEGLREDTSVVAVPSLFTVWLNGVEPLLLKLESPLYVAVMVCDPTFIVETVSVARPFPSRAPFPRVAPASWKVTVPVGIPPELAVTTDVNVTC